MTSVQLRPRRRGALAALLGLALFGAVIAYIWRLDLLAGVALLSVIGLVVARGDLAATFRETRMAIVIVAIAAGVDALTSDLAHGLALLLRFSALVFAAQTITTLWSWSEICAALIVLLRPLERLGLIDAERAAFTLLLTVRFVPVMAEEIAEIRDAQAMRGLDRSVLALTVPLCVRVLVRAEEIAEAAELRVAPAAGHRQRELST